MYNVYMQTHTYQFKDRKYREKVLALSILWAAFAMGFLVLSAAMI